MLEKVSHETMVFMRGKYRLDEIGDGKDELTFMRIGLLFLLSSGKRNERYLMLGGENFHSIYWITMTTQKHITTGNGCSLM